MANNFINHPLDKLINRQNIFSRMDSVERRTGARPSARVGQLGQMSQNTGNLVVDGELVVVNRDDGSTPVTIDAGGVTFANGATNVFFVFKDTSGNPTMYLVSSTDNYLELYNDGLGKGIRLRVKEADGSDSRFVSIAEDPANANVLQLDVDPFTTGAKISIGGEVVIWGGKDGTVTEFNTGAKDIDFDIYDAGSNLIFHVDAFDGTVAMSGSVQVTGSINVLSGGSYLLGGVNVFSTGWLAQSDTWTRTGNHTFTVSGDSTNKFRKGTRVRYKDGGSFEYGVVASSSFSVSTTTVTLITNSDYAMAAATITDNYVSYIENPEGFPQWFNFTSPTVTPSGSMTWSTTSTIHAAWRPVGKDVEVSLFLLGTTGGTASTTFTIAPPIALLSSFNTKIAVCQTRDGSAGASRVGSGYIDSTGIVAYKADVSNWTLGVSRAIIWNGHYPY